MPEEKKELIVEVKTNAAQAAKDVRGLSAAVDDLGERQQQEAEKEKTANTERARAASNLRQILEAMLSQLRNINSALGDVSASSVRTAETSEKAFKKITAYERALRKEKGIGDREETRRQILAKENFKAEQSRNTDRLNTLKLLAAGGAAIGIGKMAFSAASDVAGRGMNFLNAGALTGVKTRYIEGLAHLLKGQGGSESDATQAIGTLSQLLFNLREGFADLPVVAAKYLGNFPVRGSKAQALEHLADRFSKLSPDTAMAVGGSIGLPPALIALLRNSGGAEGWRKMMAQAMINAPNYVSDAQKMQQLVRDVGEGVDQFKLELMKWATETFKDFSPKQIQDIVKTGSQILGLLAVIKMIQLAAHPIAAGIVGTWLATPHVVKAYEKLPRDVGVNASMAIGEGVQGIDNPQFVDGKLPENPEFRNPLIELWRAVRKALFEKANPGVYYTSPLGFNFLRRFEDQLRNPFNFMGGRDYYNFVNGENAPGADNRQYAVNVENINITTRDDPQSVANAAQDGLAVAALRMIDRHTAGVYNV